MHITYVTGNAKKAETLSRYLEIPVDHRAMELQEIQSWSLEESILYKAKQAYELVGTTVLVEDVWLRFNALGRLPGPTIKLFSQDLGNEGLCKMLHSFTDRSAVAQTIFGLYDGEKLEIFIGQRNGMIAESPRGIPEFGWDAIFIPENAKKTWAEMDVEEKSTYSMKRLALEKLQAYLYHLTRKSSS